MLRTLRTLARLAFLPLVLYFAACATKRDVVVSKIKGRGTERVYPITVEQAWTISKAILHLEPTEAIEEHRADGYMLTNDSSSSVAPSTYMGVFIERDAEGAKVTFVTRRRTPTQAYASLTEGGFHRKFAEILALVAAVGSPACAQAPDAGGASKPPSPLADAGID